MNEHWLDNILEQTRMKPAELAAAANLDEGLISRLRKGKQQPTFQTLEAIHKATKIPLANIYEEVGYLPPSSLSDKLNKHYLELLNKLPVEEKKKEIRRLELNTELLDERDKQVSRTRTNHSNA